MATLRSEQLVQDIKQAFFRGEYLPGQALASQRSMSDTLGLSRSTVREAMGQLESEGFISVRPGGKTYCNNLLEVCFDMPLEGLGITWSFSNRCWKCGPCWKVRQRIMRRCGQPTNSLPGWIKSISSF
ncbi:winged helix-turn-helix domain-containing protein [Aliamphritea spongicola]|nr:winged helix-turn-helix domain-containing protein [Aliamphritea spongicola]